ncbi:MAG: PDZ domain-containing protein [Planctomycetaceae bacterium]
MNRFMKMQTAIILLLCAANTCFAQNSLRASKNVRDVFRSKSGNAAKATVGIAVQGKQVALGCVVSVDGEVVTKASLIPDGDVRLITADGNSVLAERVGTDEAFDVMLLKAQSGQFVPLQFAPEKPSIGRMVAALRDKGAVVGVGMVIVEANRTGLRKLGSAPEQPSAYLGLNLAEEESGGLRVTREVPRNAPAFPFGIRKDDVITAVAGYKVNRVQDLLRILRTKQPGDRINVKVERNGEQKRSTVRLGDRGIDKWGGGPFSKRRYNIPNVITHDIRIRPNECGGPLVSASGEVVGMNIARALRIATYAVPGEPLNKIIDSLRATQAKGRVSVEPIPSAVAKTTLTIPPPTPGAGVAGRARVAPVARVVRNSLAVPQVQPAGLPSTPSDSVTRFDENILSYSEPVPEQAIEQFVSMAQRARSRIVVIDGGESASDNVGSLKRAWKKSNGRSFHRLSVTSPDEANDASRFSILENCTAVWVTSGVSAEALSDTALARRLASVKSRKTPIAMPVNR